MATDIIYVVTSDFAETWIRSLCIFFICLPLLSCFVPLVNCAFKKKDQVDYTIGVSLFFNYSPLKLEFNKDKMSTAEISKLERLVLINGGIFMAIENLP